MPRRDVGDEYDIDYAKLEKLEKMITRVDADINRMSADKDKLAVVETLKKVRIRMFCMKDDDNLDLIRHTTFTS